MEKVSFKAAYEDRVIAYLFIPQRKDIEPPYQTVVCFPGSTALRSRENAGNAGDYIKGIKWHWEFFCKSGRAFVVPVYKATLERRTRIDTVLDRPTMTQSYADHVTYWVKDFRRTIDYLEQRPDVFASDKLAFYGLSWGAAIGPIILAVEDRIRVGILYGGGLWHERTLDYAEAIHFAPRVKQPVLMLNGTFDNIFPYETSQKPMFNHMKTRSVEALHSTYKTGHMVPRSEFARQALLWLERHLGPVAVRN